MELIEVVDHCRTQQLLQEKDDADVCLIVKGVSAGSQTRKRLFGSWGPLGTIVGTRGDNCVVMVKADKVLQAIRDKASQNKSADEVRQIRRL